jgi:hypothetical protein
MEHRANPRFEPIFLDAMVTLPGESPIRGRVLDSSRGGMAIALPKKSNLPSIGTSVSLSITEPDNSDSSKAVGKATVERKWLETDLLDNEKGIALKFTENVDDNELLKYLLQGVQQNIRLASQAKLAEVDMGYLGEYRRDLICCQMRLFVLTVTICVALASVYFGLNYHSTAKQLTNSDLSFWRTMIAALPESLPSLVRLWPRRKVSPSKELIHFCCYLSNT